MKIYFSVDPEVEESESIDNLIKLWTFLTEKGYVVFRAPYIFAENPDDYLKKELGLKKNPSYKEQRAAHMKWLDESDILLADISVPSEGRSMIIQRTLDKPKMGMNPTKIILIKGNKFNRKFGRIVKGLIESGEVIYYEYQKIENVMEKWTELI